MQKDLAMRIETNLNNCFCYFQDHSVPNGFDPNMASTSSSLSQEGFNGSKNVSYLQVTLTIESFVTHKRNDLV